MSDQSGERVGSLAEEFAKLMGVVSGLAETTGGHSSAHDESGGHEGHAPESGPSIADGSAACQACPVCQAIAFVRSTSPEVREHLTSSAASFAAAARGFLDTMAAQHTEPTKRDSHVENIDLSEDGQWD